jgi:hypothetical protein
MVRIHAGQPALLSTLLERANKRLLTKAEGEAWFAVVPAQPGNVIPLSAVRCLAQGRALTGNAG